MRLHCLMAEFVFSSENVMCLRVKSCHFLKISLLLCKINKTNLKSYSSIYDIFEIFTYWKYHQRYLYLHLFRPNTAINVNHFGSPLEAAVRVIGKPHRMLVIKIAPSGFRKQRKVTKKLPHFFSFIEVP